MSSDGGASDATPYEASTLDQPAEAPIDPIESETDGSDARDTVDGDWPRRRVFLASAVVLAVLGTVALVYRPRIAAAIFFVGVSVVLGISVVSGDSHGRLIRGAYSLLFLLVSLHYFGVIELI